MNTRHYCRYTIRKKGLTFIACFAALLSALQFCQAGTLVQVETSAGDFYLELFDEVAPRTVANFLRYVNSDRYNDTVVHRSQPGYVIQGGWLSFDEQAQTFRSIETDAPIANEFNVSNTRGTLAMAKISGDPDSATSEWFVNLNDNLTLDTNNGGFTVFARVLGDGMEVVDSIANMDRRTLTPSIPFQFPLIDYDGQTLSNANLVNVYMSVLPNVFDGENGIITLAIDAPGIGLLNVDFHIVSLIEATIQADGNSVEILSDQTGNMTTFVATTGQLFIPQLADESGILFSDIVFQLIDAEKLIFRLESLGG